MAIRMSVVLFLSRESEGCLSVHEVPDEEQEKKAFRRRRTPLCKA